jgi:hypothetical protein
MAPRPLTEKDEAAIFDCENAIFFGCGGWGRYNFLFKKILFGRIFVVVVVTIFRESLSAYVHMSLIELTCIQVRIGL